MSIRITARPTTGIRRCGIFHPSEPVVFPDSFFSEEDLDRLLNDRDLIVDVGIDGDDRAHLSILDGDGPIGESVADGRRSLYRELAEGGEHARPSSVDGAAAEPGVAAETQLANNTHESSESSTSGDEGSRAGDDGSRSTTDTSDASQTGSSDSVGDSTTDVDRSVPSTANTSEKPPVTASAETVANHPSIGGIAADPLTNRGPVVSGKPGKNKRGR